MHLLMLNDIRTNSLKPPHCPWMQPKCGGCMGRGLEWAALLMPPLLSLVPWKRKQRHQGRGSALQPAQSTGLLKHDVSLRTSLMMLCISINGFCLITNCILITSCWNTQVCWIFPLSLLSSWTINSAGIYSGTFCLGEIWFKSKIGRTPC